MQVIKIKKKNYKGNEDKKDKRNMNKLKIDINNCKEKDKEK